MKRKQKERKKPVTISGEWRCESRLMMSGLRLVESLGARASGNQ